jgi:protein-disulfide isomerase
VKKYLGYLSLIVSISACKSSDTRFDFWTIGTLSGKVITLEDLSANPDQQEKAYYAARNYYQIQKEHFEKGTDRIILEKEAYNKGMSLEELEKTFESKLKSELDYRERVLQELKDSVPGLENFSKSSQDAFIARWEMMESKKNRDAFLMEARKSYKPILKLEEPKSPYPPISTEGALFFGNKSSEIVIHLFSDFQCPYCKKAMDSVRKIIQDHSKTVAFYFHDFPLTRIHPQAMTVHIAARCAHAQGGFWEFHDGIFSDQEEIFYGSGQLEEKLVELATSLKLDKEAFSACLKEKDSSEIEAGIRLGKALKVKKTPSLYVNGRIIDRVPRKHFIDLFIKQYIDLVYP